MRREEPHPGAQLTFSDLDGHRFQVFICDSADPDLSYLEARHRGHARVEDRIRNAKQTGLANLPCHDFANNAAWLVTVLMACDLMAWTQQPDPGRRDDQSRAQATALLPPACCRADRHLGSPHTPAPPA